MALLEKDKVWKCEEVYEASKKEFDKIAIARGDKKLFSKPWRDIFAKRHNSGCCVQACRELNPSSAEEFFKNGHLVNDKMLIENICDLALRWKGYLGKIVEDVPDYLFLDNVICHNFVETFKGVNREKEVIKILIDNGYEILKSTDRDDWNLGADIIARKNGVLYFIQVKPVSFLFGRKQDCIDDRKKIFSQFLPEQLKANNGKKVPFIWLFYDYETYDWFFNPLTNNFQFDIEKVLDNEPWNCPIRDDYRKIFEDDRNRRHYMSF